MSIKYPTRCDRKSKGSGHQISFQGDSIIPNDIAKSFLTDEQNKTKLNEFIAQKFRDSSAAIWSKQFCATNGLTNVYTDGGEKVIYTPDMISVLEEADNRIVCHVNDLIQNGFSKISVKTVDSDVIVFLLGFMKKFMDAMQDLMLIVEFNSSSSRRILSMNSSYIELGHEICSGMPFFHCFTGADSTTSFFKISKKDWFSHWMNFPLRDSLTETFNKLSQCPTEEEVIGSQGILQTFVSYAYSKKIDMDLDELCFNMFEKSSSNELRTLPPSKDALLQHILRSSYQAGWVWGNTLLQHIPPPPELWGCKIYQGHLRLHWKSLDVNQHLQKIISVCQCRTNKCNACKCAKTDQKCLKFCNCCRKCENI